MTLRLLTQAARQIRVKRLRLLTQAKSHELSGREWDVQDTDPGIEAGVIWVAVEGGFIEAC
ncbi:hypothetical protein BH10PLA2_BH10PLA2_36560 [soil metagenome]